jgi:hypothetical protein
MWHVLSDDQWGQRRLAFDLEEKALHADFPTLPDECFNGFNGFEAARVGTLRLSSVY